MNKLYRKPSQTVAWLCSAAVLLAIITRGTHFHDQRFATDSVHAGTVLSAPECSCGFHSHHAAGEFNSGEETDHDENSQDEGSGGQKHPCSICVLLKNNIGQLFSFSLELTWSGVTDLCIDRSPINAFCFNQRPTGRSPPLG